MADAEATERRGWFVYGQIVLYLEMGLAILVTVFSLWMAFNGQAGWLT